VHPHHITAKTLLGALNIESRNESAFFSAGRSHSQHAGRSAGPQLCTTLSVFQKLQQQSITDGLTGIKTRRFFWEALSAEWKRASRSGRPFSVVLIDLDKFKEVNDTLGHFEGDLVLARVGRLLEQKSRQSNVVARYGGRRVHHSHALKPGRSRRRCSPNGLRQWIATDPMLSEHHITGSFGVASFPMHGFSIEDIIRVADAGMYVSKRSGGNRVSAAEEFAGGENLLRSGNRSPPISKDFCSASTTGREHLEELGSMLVKFCGGEEDCNVPLLKESIEVLSRAAESRELRTAGHGDPGGALHGNHRPGAPPASRRKPSIWFTPPAFTMWERFLCPNAF